MKRLSKQLVHGLLLHQISLIEKHHQRTAIHRFENLRAECLHLRSHLRRIHYEKHNFCLFQLLTTACNTHLFYHIIGGAEACCVDKSEERATERESVFDDIARSSVHIAHNGAIVVEQCVEERRFSRVRTAHNGNGKSIFQHISRGKRVGKTLSHAFNLRCNGIECGAIGKF